ncbi:PHF24 [Branchiostoma lanceolatum]|uniref:PHF24 protein n=1 Tax=Branchiostoma lanceolatum TaxID=7740 RepID=A0A8J9YS90_BRALA|nr:PHF24 [Branchiostoma lanceolatum]
MGVSVSRRIEARTRQVQQATQVVAAFREASSDGSKQWASPVPHDDGSRRAPGDSDGREVSYTDTSAAWAMLQTGVPPKDINVGALPKKTIRNVKNNKPRGRSNGKVHTSTQWDNGGHQDNTIVIPYETTEQVESDDLCSVCGVYTGNEIYPCRVCSKVYHEICLQKIGQCQDRDALGLLARAKTNIGWSCHECETLGPLLTEEEMQDLIDAFERCDINKDSSLSLDEYLNYRQKAMEDFDIRLSEEELDRERAKFKVMDVNQTGTLDWWEFLNFEAVRKLGRRSKNTLVRLLSPKEIDMARQTFHAFDVNNDGRITEFEARETYSRWFARFVKKETGGDGPERQKAPTLDLHVDTNARMLMDADTKSTGTVMWMDFLRDQALYILAARPNLPNFPPVKQAWGASKR